jgi:hypothetical protein
VRAAATRAGFRGDPFYLLKREKPEWTRERWDRAVSELAGGRAGNRGAPPFGGVGPLSLGVTEAFAQIMR